MYSEETIKTYMHDFNVDRDTAIKELNEINKDYEQVEKESKESLTYNSINVWSSNQNGFF